MAQQKWIFDNTHIVTLREGELIFSLENEHPGELFRVNNPMWPEIDMPSEETLEAFVKAWRKGVRSGFEDGREARSTEFRQLLGAAPVSSITDLV